MFGHKKHTCNPVKEKYRTRKKINNVTIKLLKSEYQDERSITNEILRKYLVTLNAKQMF